MRAWKIKPQEARSSATWRLEALYSEPVPFDVSLLARNSALHSYSTTYLIMLPILAVLTTQILLFHLAPSIFATPLHLDLSILFNSALLNSTSLPIINTTSPNDVHLCFDPRPDRLPTRYSDCESAVSEINTGTDMRLYTFGRGSRATYKLPRTFHSGTCVINLDMVYDDQTDKLTLPEVQQAALALALRCATGTVFNTGGVTAVGGRKVLQITIIGTAERLYRSCQTKSEAQDCKPF